MIQFPPISETPYDDKTIKERIEAIDKLIPSPAQRAAKVLEQVKLHQPEFTNWDVICFCAEYLGTMIEVLPFLDKEIHTTASLINYAHYRNPELVVGEDNGTTNGNK